MYLCEMPLFFYVFTDLFFVEPLPLFHISEYSLKWDFVNTCLQFLAAKQINLLIRVFLLELIQLNGGKVKLKKLSGPAIYEMNKG